MALPVIEIVMSNDRLQKLETGLMKRCGLDTYNDLVVSVSYELAALISAKG